MTDQQLDLAAIQARADAATPGPWGFYDGDNYADVAADMQVHSRGSYSYREKVARLEDENYWDDPAHEDHADKRAPRQMTANAEFIAAAREDVPALVAEVHRLRAELADQRAYEQRLREQHGLDVAELNRLRARVWELERPAVEAKRNEIRQSFTELIAAAEETKDYEGAFDVQCRLREREAQWKAEDTARTVAASDESHVVADDSDDPEHTDDCPGCAPAVGEPNPPYDLPDGDWQ